MRIPDELRALVGRPITPFIGAGLVRDAGVPTAASLAELLVDAGDVQIERSDNLAAVTKALEDKHGDAGAQDVVRQVIGSLPINATPALKALAAVGAGSVILTTNYDDAIEMSAEASGLRARSLDLGDALTYGPLDPDEVGVVHVHGRAASDRPLVLPGQTTLRRTGDTAYQAFTASLLAPRPVIYLGFRFGINEFALHVTLALLATEVLNAATQILVVWRQDMEMRQEHIEAMTSTGVVKVVPYDDPTHQIVTDIALFLAPRADPMGATLHDVVRSSPPGYLAPRLFAAPLNLKPGELDQMVFSAERGFSDPPLQHNALVDATRALLIASPGMGKTELLCHLARDPEQPPAVVVELKAVAGEVEDDNWPERAIARSLVSACAGRPDTPVPDRNALESSAYLLLLDGLDEVGVRRGDVVASVVAAVERWPQHRWVVTSRPIDDCAVLVDAGFETFRLWPSERWGSEYLHRRGIDGDARRSLEESGGFDDLISIPLFAAAAADRLLDGKLPARPLDLLVDIQRDAADREQQRKAVDGTLFKWVRRLAVGLELRGRSTASTAELSAVAGTGAPEGTELRERLIRSTLLAELPDIASFQRKTFQEALCADAILASDDMATVMRKIGVADIAGEPALRSDIDFTIDLVFENGTRDQRAAVRELDPLRWARTVITSGSEDDADEAFQLIWQSLSEPHSWLGAYADAVIRSPRRAVVAIARKWPQIIERRREKLVEETRSLQPTVRHNAIIALGAVGPGEEREWLIPLLTDSDERVAAAAISAIGSWQVPSLADDLWAALESTDASSDVWPQILVALAELVATPEEFERIALTADQRVMVLRRLLGHLLSGMEREHVVALLAHWPSRRDLWREVIARGFHSDADPWTDAQVGALTRSLLTHGVSVADVAELAPLRVTFAEHSTAVLDVLTEFAEVHRRDPSIFALLWALPPKARMQAEVPPLASYLAELDEHVEAYPPPPPPVGWADRVADELDTGEIDETHPRVEIDWPRDLDADHLERLAELTKAWWPQKSLRDVRVHSAEPEDDQAIAAVSAGAASDAPLSRSRWLELVEATHLLGLIPRSYEWLARRYEPAWEAEMADVVRRVPDGAAMSSTIAALPKLSEPLLGALGGRLGELDETGGWSNAVGLLRERGHAEALRPLLNKELTERQRRAVLGALAEYGDIEAQIAVLEDMIERARRGENVDGFSWREPVGDPRVVELLGDLILALPYVEPPRGVSFRYGRDPRPSAEVTLAVADTEAALAVHDRLISEDDTGRRYDLNREAVLRRLAAAAVLNRLPSDLALAADVVLDSAERND